jgi:hypothetical protein
MIGWKAHLVLLPSDVNVILTLHSPRTSRFAPSFAVVSDCCLMGVMSVSVNPREKKKFSEIADRQLLPESMRASTDLPLIAT